jgi:bifunctional non-homologous end joining protein LigD
MSLGDYSRKRKFAKTPEPPPPPAALAASANRFCVQRHSARRLHYDLRLELNGVLLSWAVPKGPTLDPEEKRLAVHVEDHPIAYGEFEGTIPAGNYGAGSVLLWDRGTYELLGSHSAEKQLERGDFKFRLHGEKLMGEFALVKIKRSEKGNEWLLIKKKDFAAKLGWDAESDLRSVGGVSDPALLAGALEAKVPVEVTPMMAFSSASLPQGPDWLYEIKWDGVRALCFLEGKKVRLTGRSGKAMEAQYPELAGIAQQLNARTAVLDGEIVAFDAKGVPSFAEIQPRIGARPQNVNALSKTNPVTFFAFDLVYLEGYDLRQVALIERKRMLSSRISAGGVLRFSEHFPEGENLLQAAREKGLEGVVAKSASSRYEFKRSASWIKVKVVAQQDFVICGFTALERQYFGSLVLGVYERGKLHYVGNVGTGFTEDSLKRIHAQLQKLVIKKSPFAEVPKIPGETTWVKPQLVAAVRFNAWTRDDRLRAPVFLGLRDDISPEECVRETPMAEASAAAPARLDLLPPEKSEIITQVGKQSLKFTNLNKVFYPQEGFTKRDVINYYDAVADLILPHLRDRPLSLKRYPNGIEQEFFFQKNAAEKFPGWLRTVPIASDKKKINFVVADDRESLLYLANLGCIDQNPWLSRVATLEHPDFILIDLDPYHCGYDRIVEAAQLVHAKLDQMGLQGFPKTTGGDGMHIYVPLEPRYSYEQVRNLAEVLARLVAAERPDMFTTPRTVSQREKGKVYFDYLQIREGSTISAPYVLRAYPGAPVSTPLRWNEVVKGLSPANFTIRNAPDRFARLGDLFEPVLRLQQRLEDALQRLESMVAGAKR